MYFITNLLNLKIKNLYIILLNKFNEFRNKKKK